MKKKKTTYDIGDLMMEYYVKNHGESEQDGILLGPRVGAFVAKLSRPEAFCAGFFMAMFLKDNPDQMKRVVQ